MFTRPYGNTGIELSILGFAALSYPVSNNPRLIASWPTRWRAESTTSMSRRPMAMRKNG